ncbi:lysozyme inhibitor LprI family protein [Afipia clevelandensis]|uniref:Lysozyme inhibitor LprI N-terminal domain-containing protein n=1 Tax=Afipia clevelandensis ATCC 49720 TaxID=883079 RepID=K8P0R8_9BRAD|nr:hypothetical protein [Afipia clevelandensis]EKS33240.1 hypothetical protein HMPREF9696_03281 [Afipia clevelandensis ATCC 49720]
MNFSRSVIGVSAALLIFGAAFSSADAADYSPLDCKKASSPTERTICSDYGLGQSEARVATLYGVTTSLVAMGQRGTIQDDQRIFLRQRDACGSNTACLRAAYAARDKQLEAVMQSIQQRGPF